MTRPPPISTLFPYTTLFRSDRRDQRMTRRARCPQRAAAVWIHIAPPGNHMASTLKLEIVTPEAKIYSEEDRKSTRLNSSHVENSYAGFCLKKKKKKKKNKEQKKKKKYATEHTRKKTVVLTAQTTQSTMRATSTS